MTKKADMSLASRSLRYKLKISFYLMSILPLLVCIYLVSNYVLPYVGVKVDVVASIAISTIIAVAGFLVIKEVFDRIVSVSTVAKLIAAGNIHYKLDIEHQDEVGDLGHSLNQLTARIRSNMDELKTYSEKTTEINLDIQKRVLVLSSLLQISSLVSQSAKLEDILRVATEKARLLANSDVSYLLYRDEEIEDFCVKIADGANSEYLLKIMVEPQEPLFQKAININKPLILDKENMLSENLTVDFYEKFRLKNTLALPIFLSGRVTAMLGIGNTAESFLYKREDMELLDIFSKQIAIAIENDKLMQKVEKLEIKDVLTGLYNESFIRSRLEEEIKRSIVYHRPCAFILFDIDNFSKFQQQFGSRQTEAILKRIGSLIKDSLSDVDRAARSGDDQFAIILPEKNKRQAQKIAEGIRKNIELTFTHEPDMAKRITVSGGISENPLDGIDAEELITAAGELVALAKKQGRNRIVSFKEAEPAES